jgi:hypothetical protein
METAGQITAHCAFFGRYLAGKFVVNRTMHITYKVNQLADMEDNY